MLIIIHADKMRINCIHTISIECMNFAMRTIEQGKKVADKCIVIFPMKLTTVNYDTYP